MDVLLYEGERLDRTGFGELSLIQKPEEFCYGVDAVLLADFVKVKKGGQVIDLGTGTGIIPLILSHKTEASQIWAVEVQETSYERACRNIRLNALEKRVHVIHADVKQLPKLGMFDAVITNPPYVKNGGGLKNDNEAKRIARHETTAGLEDFIQAAAKLLKDKGDFYMVHRPDRLVDICYICRQMALEPKELRFVSPDMRTKPNILLVHCVKNGNPELKLLDPLFIYADNREYSPEILKIYERDKIIEVENEIM